MEKTSLSSLSIEEREMFLRVYKLTSEEKSVIVHSIRIIGQTVDEVARRFGITPPDVNRILHPQQDAKYGKYTAEEKLRHWIAGKRRAETVKKQREAKKTKPKFTI